MYIFFLDLCNKTFFCLNELLLCCVRSSHNWLEVKNRVQGCHWAGVNSSPITGPNVGEILFFYADSRNRTYCSCSTPTTLGCWGVAVLHWNSWQSQSKTGSEATLLFNILHHPSQVQGAEKDPVLLLRGPQYCYIFARSEFARAEPTCHNPHPSQVRGGR